MASSKELALSLEQARELFSYDPDTGVLTWKKGFKCGANRVAPAGTIAGCTDSYGYLVTRTNRSGYKNHRLSWLLYYGEWPKGSVDHIDGDKANNRIANLRIATNSENLQNQRKPMRHNKLGILGVSMRGDKYTTKVHVNGADHYLGVFDTPEEAHEAYIKAKRDLHPYSTL